VDACFSGIMLFPCIFFFNLVTAPNAAKSIVSATISVVAIGR
jgi:hypothetical protein